ncbi:MAG TPA: hypothetical protein VLR49_06320 [Ferruginibacter sp.]|nr:hypothetical protein [Ferruginibacter sp.]
MEKTHMTTLTSVLEKLRVNRQDNEITMTEVGFNCNSTKMYLTEDLTIIKTYRFEGESDPGDSAILYLIQANDGLIGYSIDTYGAYSNNADGYDDFVKKIKMEDRDDQVIE